MIAPPLMATGTGLRQLADHKSLKSLNAGMTKVIAAGVEALRLAAPGIAFLTDAKKK